LETTETRAIKNHGRRFITKKGNPVGSLGGGCVRGKKGVGGGKIKLMGGPRILSTLTCAYKKKSINLVQRGGKQRSSRKEAKRGQLH